MRPFLLLIFEPFPLFSFVITPAWIVIDSAGVTNAFFRVPRRKCFRNKTSKNCCSKQETRLFSNTKLRNYIETVEIKIDSRFFWNERNANYGRFSLENEKERSNNCLSVKANSVLKTTKRSESTRRERRKLSDEIEETVERGESAAQAAASANCCPNNAVKRSAWGDSSRHRSSHLNAQVNSPT